MYNHYVILTMGHPFFVDEATYLSNLPYAYIETQYRLYELTNDIFKLVELGPSQQDAAWDRMPFGFIFPSRCVMLGISVQ